MDEDTGEPKATSPGYVWAEVGALAGAIATGIPAGLAWAAAVAPFLFSSDGWYLVASTAVALALVIVGSAFGCRFLLRRRNLPEADRTALILGLLLAALYAIGFWSSDTELQSDLLPYLTALAPLMPLVARWIAVSRS